MDDRLKKALDFSNYMVTLNNQKLALKEKFLDDCVHYENGGKFSVTKDLITFCKVLIDCGNDDQAVLIDDNDLPIEIADMNEFFSKIVAIYSSSANSYYTEYQKIKSTRSIEKMIL
jgi:hypothetical protein